MSIETPTIISLETYLTQEAEAEFKSEYHNGEVVAMAGAQMLHNQLVSNLIFLINRCLWGTNCQVFPSDFLLKMPEHCNQYVYPDVTIVCGEIKIEQHRGLDVLLNPAVVVEVLSSSTRGYDQGDKMKCYLELESLEQYVMVDSEKLEASSYTKNSGNDWLYQTFQVEKDMLSIQQCEIELAELYRNVKFEKNI